VDGWAGSVPHTFGVVFNLAATVQEGLCRVRLGLLDTQAGAPPRLEVRVNNEVREAVLSAGSGDASIQGDPKAGKRQEAVLEFPVSALIPGDNHLRITTSSGSWMLYDFLRLEGPAGLRLGTVEAFTWVDAAQPVLALRKVGDELRQAVEVQLRHLGPPIEGRLMVEGVAPIRVELADRMVRTEILVPAVSKAERREVRIEVDGRLIARREVELRPVRQRTIYILPHSHTDIGYTEIQTAIEEKQVENLRKGMAYAQRTANYPEGARFVWNVEVLWAAELFLKRRPPEEQEAFFAAVKSGQVVLNGMYLNELTGLCRSEELLRLFRYSTELAAKTQVPIDSVMISDVPGYTWGTVTAMAQAGIRYFSTAPNYFDRIGDILQRWENKPFWWMGPSGKERVLVWIPYKGYAMSHIYRQLTPAIVTEYQTQLEKAGYPYDIAYMRWSGHGDNAEPDPSICEFVRDWNGRNAWPRFVISGTGEAFRAFEARYGDQLPEVRGDWTPYWEDGAGSSALETAMNRASSDRVTQAEALFALRAPDRHPVEAFRDAWRDVLLYSEHTWGAWCSVSDPESQATREQWEIKRSYALEADRRSRELLTRAMGEDAGLPGVSGSQWDVVNTLGWPRSALVSVPPGIRPRNGEVVDDQGRKAPSQHLKSGDWVYVARDVPGFGMRRYRVIPLDAGVGRAEPCDAATAGSNRISNGLVSATVDPISGAIVELTGSGFSGNWVDTAGGEGLNDYRFLPGDRLEDVQRNGPVTITVTEPGPVVAELRMESSAPGCRRLVRDIRVIAGLGWVELANTVDKERAATPTRAGDWQFAQKGGKESVNFAFPFRVPDGQLRMELPIGTVRPEADQMPSACKNWFTVGRWADVSNDRSGITWFTLDAPLVEVGGITANLVGSQSNPDVWRKKVEPTQRIYSWVMNNHWGTNYRSYQEGPVLFRFVLQPHGAWTPSDATRMGLQTGQPLLVMPAGSSGLSAMGRLKVEPPDVLVTGLKPADDGRGWVVRLYGASGQDQAATLIWSDPKPARICRSDTSESWGAAVGEKLEVPGNGIVTLRVGW